MKKILLLSFAFLLITGLCNAQVKTPPHAASTRTWRFGNQVWSDIIQIPACNKKSFDDSDDFPDCCNGRSARSGYYYNWAYVNAYKSTLCPGPWRIPTKDDFEALLSFAGYGDLNRQWGCGPFSITHGNIADESCVHYYWAAGDRYAIGTWPNRTAPRYAAHLTIGADYAKLEGAFVSQYFAVRCLLGK
jgi:hypothetical protein